MESRYVQQSEQMIFFDSIQKAIGQHQSYGLNSYLVYPIISFHRLFASTQNPTLEFPSTTFQADSAARQLRNISTSFWNGITTNLRSYWFNYVVNITELTPFLMYIISPEFNPVITNFKTFNLPFMLG